MTTQTGRAWRPSDELLDIWNKHRTQFARRFAGEPVDYVPAINGIWGGASHGLWGTNTIDMLTEPDAWLEDVFKTFADRESEFADSYTFRPAVIELDFLGTHFIDVLFGADVRFHADQVWAEPTDIEVGKLHRPDITTDPLFCRSLELARKAVAASDGRIFISPPVFACAINIGVNLFGQRLLAALVEDPEAAEHDLAIINDVITEATRAFQAILPEEIRLVSVGADRYMPPGFGLIDGCATQLISARHYRKFFMALDDALLSLSPRGGMMHICGAHAQHIPAWHEMQSLRCLQLNDRAAEDLPAYYDGLREDQILYLMPTATMTAERAMEITGGRRMVVQCLLPQHIQTVR